MNNTIDKITVSKISIPYELLPKKKSERRKSRIHNESTKFGICFFNAVFMVSKLLNERNAFLPLCTVKLYKLKKYLKRLLQHF